MKGGLSSSSAEEGCSSAAACFDCNICLDYAADPVVTLCGHLFCWQCVYRWLRSDHTASGRCPVCKNHLSEDALIPLYGRGTPEKARSCHGGDDIPSRPPAALIRARTTTPAATSAPSHGLQIPELHQYSLLGSPYYSAAGGVVAEMALAVLLRMSQNQAAYPRHQHHLMLDSPVGSSRRQAMAERSLHLLWLLLFFFALLFFLMF